MTAIKWVSDAVLDAALSYISANADQLSVCTDLGSSPTYSTATTAGTRLAIKTGMTSGDFTGPAAGSQRQLTVNQQATLSVTNSGTAANVALTKSSGSVLLYMTTCTSQVLTSGNTVTVPSWVISIASPT